MSAVLIAMITALSTVVAAAVPSLIRSRRELRVVARQVTNNHSTNLRDDITAIAHRLDMVLLDTSWLRHEQAELGRRVDHLEEKL